MAAMETRRQLADVDLVLSANAPMPAEYLRWHFDVLPQLAQSRSGPEIRIHLNDVAARLAIRDTLKTTDVRRRIGQMDVAVGGDMVVAHHDRGGSLIGSIGDLQIELASSAEDQWIVVRQLLFVGLSFSLALLGRAVLHGALLARGDSGLLVLGGTGQGKSTFALAGLQHGYAVHSDDLVMAVSDDHGLALWGIPKRLSVPGANPMIEPDGTLVPGDPRGRMFLELDAISHGRLDGGGVVLAGHHDADGAISAISPQQVQAAVMSSFEFVDHPELLHRCFAVLVAVGALPGFHAQHSVYPADRLRVAAEMLDRCYEPPV